MRYLPLVLVAIMLFAVLLPFALLAKITCSLKGDWFKRVALSIDQLGNVVCDSLFNWLLIKKHSTHQFGNEDETVSSVLGKNYLGGTLSPVGQSLRNMLHTLDPNHTVESIEGDEN